MADVKAPAKKAGNKSSEIIIGAAAQKLASAASQIVAAGEVLKTFDTKVAQSTLEIVNLEDRIGSLQQEYANKVAQNKIDTQLAFDTNRESFVQQWLGEKGLIPVLSADWNKLQSELQTARTDVDKAVAKEVAIVSNRLNTEHQNQIKTLNLENQLKEADNKAKITQLAEQNKFLAEQADSWKKALDAERQAGIERARASSIGTLNVGTPSR